MKILILLCLIFCNCGAPKTEKNMKGRFVLVKDFGWHTDFIDQRFSIIKDTETGVEYLRWQTGSQGAAICKR